VWINTFPPAAVIDGVTAAFTLVAAKLLRVKRQPTMTARDNDFAILVLIFFSVFGNCCFDEAHA